MSEPSAPGWLALLRAQRWEIGQPSYRKIAENSGLSHTTVTNVLKGTDTPTRNSLRRLIEGLYCTPEVTEQVLGNYDSFNYFDQKPEKPVISKRSDDVLILADAINNLADAIRSLNRPEQP